MIRINWNPTSASRSRADQLVWAELDSGFYCHISPPMVRSVAATPNQPGITVSLDRRRLRGRRPDLLRSPERAVEILSAPSSCSGFLGRWARVLWGLFGGIVAAHVWTRHRGFNSLKVADLFAPAIATGSAIGRISCWLAGMDYGTPTSLPWGAVYLNPNSFAPVDSIARHPAQVYELIGDLIIAFVLIRWRRSCPKALCSGRT